MNNNLNKSIKNLINNYNKNVLPLFERKQFVVTAYKLRDDLEKLTTELIKSLDDLKISKTFNLKYDGGIHIYITDKYYIELHDCYVYRYFNKVGDLVDFDDNIKYKTKLELKKYKDNSVLIINKETMEILEVSDRGYSFEKKRRTNKYKKLLE